jgi:N-acetylglucosaminyldiphosphoundecaprenol N-acetyl-beta-D-mannosaminyltransferase
VHFNVLGARISALGLDQAVGLLADRIVRRQPGYVCVCTVNDVVESLRDPAVQASINDAWLATPDGMPLVWWGRLTAPAAVDRVYGPDLLHALLTDPRHRQTRHFFYGGTPRVRDALVRRARQLNPDVQIVGALAPPFRPQHPDEEAADLARIDGAAPDVVWVGL